MSDPHKELLHRVFQAIPEEQRIAFLREVMDSLPRERVARLLKRVPAHVRTTETTGPVRETKINRSGLTERPSRPFLTEPVKAERQFVPEPKTAPLPAKDNPKPEPSFFDMDEELNKIRAARGDVAGDTRRQFLALILWGLLGMAGFALLTFLGAKTWFWLMSLF